MPIRHGERLCEQFHAKLHVPIADRGVFGIAGDEQDLQARAERASSVRYLAPVKAAGQTDIGDEQINAGVGLKHLEPGGPVGGTDNGVAKLFEHLFDQVTDCRFVVDNQHRLPLPTAE